MVQVSGNVSRDETGNLSPMKKSKEKRVDEFEEHARRFLEAQGHAVTFEPDGNVPPDFLVDGSVAVEVRRLNRNRRLENGSLEGLEQARNRIYGRTRKVCESLGVGSGDRFYVRPCIVRPTPDLGVFARELRALLLEVRKAVPVDLMTATLQESGVEIRIKPRQAPHPNQFVPEGYRDPGGAFFGHALVENLRFCIEEKTAKVAGHRHKYPEWWLVLVDCVALAFDDDDYARFQAETQIEHGWDRVLLISPKEPKLLAEW